MPAKVPLQVPPVTAKSAAFAPPMLPMLVVSANGDRSVTVMFLVFAGFDGVGSFLFRLVHLGDTYTPINPDTLGQRLEAAGFTDVAVERGRARFRFRATQGYPGTDGILS